MPVSERKDEQPIRSGEDFMRRFFPKEYARRKAEGRCIDCGSSSTATTASSRTSARRSAAAC